MNTEKPKDSEILSNILHELNVPVQTFTNKIGYKTTQTVYNILNEDAPITERIIKSIGANYPEVNIEYVRRGKKPVILNQSKTISQANLFGAEISNTTAHDIKEIKLLLMEVLVELRKNNAQ